MDNNLDNAEGATIERPLTHRFPPEVVPCVVPPVRTIMGFCFGPTSPYPTRGWRCRLVA